MALIHSQLPRIQSPFVLRLRDAILQYMNSLNIAIRSSIMKQSIERRIYFFQLAAIFNQPHQTIVIVVSYCDHWRCFFELIMRCEGKDLLFKDEAENLDVACACQEVEDIAFVLV